MQNTHHNRPRTNQHMGLVPRRLCAGTAPPCAYADRHHVRLKRGRLGPLEIVKAAEPPLDRAMEKYKSVY